MKYLKNRTNQNQIAKAREFARQRHDGQTTKGSGQKPYIRHIEEVAALTREFGGDNTAICAAWLHDTVEDCDDVSLEFLEAEFSPEIAALVKEMTDDMDLKDYERKQQQVKHAPYISEDACLIKIADKLSNLHEFIDAPPPEWSHEHRIAYINWAREVISRLPHQPTAAIDRFISIYDQALMAENKRGGKADAAGHSPRHSPATTPSFPQLIEKQEQCGKLKKLFENKRLPL